MESCTENIGQYAKVLNYKSYMKNKLNGYEHDRAFLYILYTMQHGISINKICIFLIIKYFLPLVHYTIIRYVVCIP